jgi:Mn-dependent DtxR family transcriptional regulator
MPESVKATTAAQDYLEAIYELIADKGYAKVVDIAEKLDLSGPSVTRMVQKLSREGFLKSEKYRGIIMTDKGKTTARDMQRRHQLLREFLILLGVDQKTANADAEGMEHHVSRKTLRCIDEFVKANQ